MCFWYSNVICSYFWCESTYRVTLNDFFLDSFSFQVRELLEEAKKSDSIKSYWSTCLWIGMQKTEKEKKKQFYRFEWMWCCCSMVLRFNAYLLTTEIVSVLNVYVHIEYVA